MFLQFPQHDLPKVDVPAVPVVQNRSLHLQLSGQFHSPRRLLVCRRPAQLQLLLQLLTVDVKLHLEVLPADPPARVLVPGLPVEGVQGPVLGHDDDNPPALLLVPDPDVLELAGPLPAAGLVEAVLHRQRVVQTGC